ncbi:GAS2-like protein pickled eggs [Aethina tumida]|uniref:GAS2-like protein pickled eggs n=1 Tax=Aethina tumida TaxID=116153 RepID=UPI002147562C|nr:GAS2-like protein pickled eggs [Aethina tumida]
MENQKNTVLLESRPFRPFKSGDEYLFAMKEDLAEWLQTMYPHLGITTDNFFEKLETGVALCEHANAVKQHAIEYVQKKQAKKMMTKSVTGSLAMRTVTIADVKYFTTAKPGTFFARDNVSNFIKWCRHSIEIIECLLFETDDLILRKNEKNFILCLLEVARQGAKFGVLAPMLIQMERQIDREIAADNKKMAENDGNENDNSLEDDSDSDLEEEETPLIYGPVPQIVTNDLKSLDEMVRDLVEKCTCPTQFPMIRVSEGKYRIGDTKVLIFVRILRNHVMVRVGGGWDTLAHYLDKHDPCRCRAQHRTTQGARLVNKVGAVDLHGSHVYYDRQPVSLGGVPNVPNGVSSGPHSLGPPTNCLNRSRSRSPSHLNDRRSVSPNFPRKHLSVPASRSRSPTPNYTSTYTTKLATKRGSQGTNHYSGPHSLPYEPYTPAPKAKYVTTAQYQTEPKSIMKSEVELKVNDTDTQSDTTSEMSDEGYRSLPVNKKEDAEDNEHQQVCTADDLNDVGLRKTQYSQIYDNGDAKSPKPVQKPTQKPRERSFVKANSMERSDLKPPPTQKRTSRGSINSTWSGRPKATRASLTGDTFSPPVARSSMGRRSISNERQTSSANTSPTKSNLKKELLKAVNKNADEAQIMAQVQAVLKKFGSMNQLPLDDEPRLTRNNERMSFRSPRKDSRADKSKIPAPISYKA